MSETFEGINTRNYCIGVGTVFVNGVPVGGTEGDLVLIEKQTMKHIDNASQKPATILDTRILSNNHSVRFTMSEATLENIKNAINAGAISTQPGGSRRISLGTDPVSTFISKFTFEFYGVGPDEVQRKLFAFRAAFIDPGEINFSGDNFTKIPVTLQFYPDPSLPATANVGYIEDKPVSPD